MMIHVLFAVQRGRGAWSRASISLSSLHIKGIMVVFMNLLFKLFLEVSVIVLALNVQMRLCWNFFFFSNCKNSLVLVLVRKWYFTFLIKNLCVISSLSVALYFVMHK